MPCKYAAIGPFSGGAAPEMSFEDKRAFVDAEGNEITPFIYGTASPSETEKDM